jgi:hypothetical protein
MRIERSMERGVVEWNEGREGQMGVAPNGGIEGQMGVAPNGGIVITWRVGVIVLWQGVHCFAYFR